MDETARPAKADEETPTPAEVVDEVARKILSKRARRRIAVVLRWAGAVLLTAAALLLGVVPGLPGVPLFLIALFLVAPDFPPARRLATKIQRKIPKRMRKLVPKSWRRHAKPRRLDA